jgi:hypothetical protein
VPPDGLVARLKHGTQLVKWIVPGLVARRACRGRPSLARIKLKRLYFLLNLVFLTENVFNITKFELNKFYYKY